MTNDLKIRQRQIGLPTNSVELYLDLDTTFDMLIFSDFVASEQNIKMLQRQSGYIIKS